MNEIIDLEDYCPYCVRISFFVEKKELFYCDRVLCLVWQQIRHHVVHGVIEILQMTNDTVLPTLRQDHNVRFYQFGDSK